MRRDIWGVLVTSALMAAALAAEASDIPLPPDLKEVPHAADLSVGSRALKSRMFLTQQTSEEIRDFYAASLQAAGWTIRNFEWQQQMRQRRQALEEQLAKLDDKSLKVDRATLQKVLDQSNQMMQSSIYAEQGQQRVLIQCAPREGQTSVLIHEWEEQAGVDTLSGAAGKWPMENPCCSAEVVPPQRRVLAEDVPAYPAARLLVTGSPPGNRKVAGMAVGAPRMAGQLQRSEMYLSPDSVDQVAKYYEREMPAHGWRRFTPPGANRMDMVAMMGAMAKGMKSRGLLFRNERALCMIGIVEQTKDQILELPWAPPQPAPQEGEEPPSSDRTAILLTYFAMPEWVMSSITSNGSLPARGSVVPPTDTQPEASHAAR